MKTVTIDTKIIVDKRSFHAEFKKVMGFPDYYGMNMDAWLECMVDALSGTAPGFTKDLVLGEGEVLCIELTNTEDFYRRLPDFMRDLVECVASLNDSARSRQPGSVCIKFLS